MAYTEAESEALLDLLGVTHGNETREETVERLKAALKFAEKSKADTSHPPKKAKRPKRR